MSGGSLRNWRTPSRTTVRRRSARAWSLARDLARSRSTYRTLRACDLDRHQLEELARVEAQVPDLEVAHRGELAHRLAIRPDALEDDRGAVLPAEPAVPRRDLEARRESLHIPFERARQRLVEVVHAEDVRAFRGPEGPEVRQVGVAAQLDRQPGPCQRREIRGHDRCRAPVERERGRQHAPVPDRHELRRPVGRLALEDRDRIAVVGRRPVGVARAGHPRARGTSALGPLRRSQGLETGAGMDRRRRLANAWVGSHAAQPARRSAAPRTRMTAPSPSRTSGTR